MGAHEGHSHAHGSSRSIRAAFFLNISFTIIEVVGGLLTNSMAILSDAVHDLGDSVALALSWRLENLSGRRSDNRRTFGYRRYSVLGAVISAMILIGGSSYILVEAIPRLINPQPVSERGMLAIAVVGIVVNSIAVLRLRGGSKLNQRVVFLHLIEDVLGWAAVLVASIVMLFVDLPILDPILSVAITVFVLAKIIPNLRSSLRVFLQFAPDDVDVEEVSGRLAQVESVVGVHDVHVWSLDGEYTVFSGHIVIDRNADWRELEELKSRLRAEAAGLGINHSTFEFEPSDRVCEECDLYADEDENHHHTDDPAGSHRGADDDG